ncbi:MAG: PD-(D/E)XK nuclease family protein [Candidatus Omnitrophica bacterium]|nr:PD-(D/E)XK nuclease family protein [Candidatus Omnitrophota bacterium]
MEGKKREALPSSEGEKGQEVESMLLYALSTGNWSEYLAKVDNDPREVFKQFKGFSMSQKEWYEYTLGNYLLMKGETDLIYRRENKSLIIDIKKTFSPAIQPRHIKQTNYYAYALLKKAYAEYVKDPLSYSIEEFCRVDTAIFFVPLGRLVDVGSYTLNNLDALECEIKRDIRRAENILKAERVYTKPSNMCQYCDFPVSCPNPCLTETSTIEEIADELVRMAGVKTALTRIAKAYVEQRGNIKLKNGETMGFHPNSSGKLVWKVKKEA